MTSRIANSSTNFTTLQLNPCGVCIVEELYHCDKNNLCVTTILLKASHTTRLVQVTSQSQSLI